MTSNSSHFSFKDYKGFKKVSDFNSLYVLKDEIGSGAFSTVYKSINKLTDREVAVKVISKSFVRQSTVYE